MGKKRQYGDDEPAPRRAGGGPEMGGGGRPRPGILDDEDIPRPKKVKPQNLEKLSIEELHQRKHDLKQEENYQNMVMSKKKRGPYSASDIRATYTQVLRFQYLQKEVDLEIERREARKEKQAEAKAMKRQQQEEAQRARRAAIMAAEAGYEGDAPGVALPPEFGGSAGASQFQDFHSMGATSMQGSSASVMDARRGGGGAYSNQPSFDIPGASSSSSGMGQGFFGAGGCGGCGGASDTASTSTGSATPMNPMMMMAQMMLETQKKLKEAQEKMQQVQDMHGSGGGSGFPG